MSDYTPSELFASTAPFNARPGHDQKLYDLLKVRFGLDGTQRVLEPDRPRKGAGRT